MPAPTIAYKANPLGVVPPPIPPWAEELIIGMAEQAGVPAMQITSTWRTPEDQARIMYDNIKTHGVQSQLDLYGNNGDRVIRLYDASLPRDMVEAAMAALIRQIGPEKFSNHMNPASVTFDISPKSINGGSQDPITGAAARFLTVLKGAEAQGIIGELEYPPRDPAFHIEFPIQGRGGWPPGAPDSGGGDPGVGKTIAAVAVTGLIFTAIRAWWKS